MKIMLSAGLKVWVLVALVLTGANAYAEVDRQDPFVMVSAVGSNTFARIKLEKDIIKNNPEALRTIMEEELLPYVDYKFSAFKVLGKYTQDLEREKLLEFVSVFREYLITSYAVAMGYYDDQVVVFEPGTDFEGRSDVTVRAVIKDNNRPDIKVAFKVRKGRNSNEWEAYDMVAEGISMLSSKRSEFETIIRKDGVDKVIELMRESIAQPIKINQDK